MTLALALCAAITASAISGVTPLYDDQIVAACDHSGTVVDVATEYSLDPFVISALIHYESRWRTESVSVSKACGLTQVLAGYSPFTCDELKVPEIGIGEGGRALRYWLNWAKGDYRKGLACYRVGFACDNSPVGRNYASRIMGLADQHLEAVVTHGEWCGYDPVIIVADAGKQ